MHLYPYQKQAIEYIFEDGQCYGLAGHNGIGKTTLLESIAGMRELHQGQIWFGNEPLRGKRLKRQYWNKHALRAAVIQLQHVEESWLGDTVEQELAYWSKTFDIEQITDRSVTEHAEHYFELFGVTEKVRSSELQHLSIGQQKKVALAFAFMSESRWLLLDEPLAALDYEGQQALLTALQQRKGAGLGTIIISHQLVELIPYLDHLVTLENNTLVEQNVEVWQVNDQSIEELLYQQMLKQHVSSEGIVGDEQVTAYPANRLGNYEQSIQDEHKAVERWNQYFDPRSVLVGLLLCSTLIIIWNDWISLGAYSLLTMAILIIFRSRMKKWLPIMISFACMVIIFTLVGGIQLFPFSFNSHSALNILLRMTQLLVIIGLSLPIMELLTPFRLQRALEQSFGWLIKLRVPIYSYTMLISLIFSLIPKLVQKWNRTIAITRVKLNVDKAFSWNGVMVLVMPYTRGILKLADQLATSLELRGYTVSKLGTHIVYKVKWSKQDTLLLLVIICYSLLIAAAQLIW